MNPDQFNLLAGLGKFQPDTQVPTIDNMSSNDLTLSAVDSSGNMTMPSLGQGLQIAGTVLNAYGDVVAGKESKAAYDYNAQLALDQGQVDLLQLDKGEADTLSTQRAMYAKAGVTMSGSPLDVAVNTASQFEMDKQIANYNAQSKAAMDTYEGEVAKQQGEFKAGMSLLSGAADLAMIFAFA